MAKEKDFDYSMDLFEMFGGDSMPSLLASDGEVGDADSVDLSQDDQDDIEEDVEMEAVSLDSKTATSASKKDSKSKSKSINGKTEINLPLVCYGRNWEVLITENGTCTYNELVKKLYDMGIKEVALSAVSPLPISDGKVFFTSPVYESQSDLQVNTQVPCTVCDGMAQMEISEECFPGLHPDEISVLRVQEKWEKQFPIYENQSLRYEGKCQVATPYLDIALVETEEIQFPCVICKSGAVFKLNANDFPLLEKVTAADLVAYLFNGKPPVKVTLKRCGNTIFTEYSAPKGSSIVNVDRECFVVDKNAKEAKAKELFTLPFSVYFVTLNITIPLTSENFGGKDKVSEEEVLELMKRSYSLLRSKDRTIECVYAREQNIVSIALTSGKKGNAYVLPESECVGLFKLLRDNKDLVEAMNQDSFLGNYVPHSGSSQRVEVTPIGTFLGTYGKEKDLMSITEVAFISKLPKIPSVLFDTICADFKAHMDVERIMRIYWNQGTNGYQLVSPDENTTKASKIGISYQFPKVPSSMKLVLTIHSHNTMPAYFSSTDDADEAITGLYGVVGTLGDTPTARFRVGMEGCFSDLTYDMLFE